jgi:GMP synthase (glutamine-hydrolysing)
MPPAESSFMTRVIALQHYKCETLGALGDALADAQIEWEHVSVKDGERADADLRGVDGLVILGGPFSVYRTDRYPFLKTETEIIRRALALGKPILGICLGSQLLASALGGDVRAAAQPEIGWLPVSLEPAAGDDRLFHDLPERFVTCVWHADVFDLPSGAVSLARSANTQCQAFRYGGTTYGLLFHLEMKAEMVEACVAAFEPRLRNAGIQAEYCITEAGEHIAAASPVAKRVFGRWAELVRRHRA